MVEIIEKTVLILSINYLVEKKEKQMLSNKIKKHKIHTKSLSNNKSHNKSTWNVTIVPRSHHRSAH